MEEQTTDIHQANNTDHTNQNPRSVDNDKQQPHNSDHTNQNPGSVDNDKQQPDNSEHTGSFDNYKKDDVYDGSNARTEFKSSDGNIFWIPDVPDNIRPTSGARYPSYEDVKAMYYFYGVEGGFDIRKTSRKMFNGKITLQYFVCNRQGEPNTSLIDTLDSNNSKTTRRVDMHRQGCEAHIKVRIVPDSTEYEIYEAVEKHNHSLYSKHNSHLSKTARKLDSLQKAFILRMSAQNIGPTIAHRLFYGFQGGYNYKGGNVDDFKNYKRDLNVYIGGSDAQLLVNKMNDKKNFVTNFSFEYTVDNNRLNRLFWADDTSKIHYKEFGDVVSFDATFRTNRYDMVFVPFTGIDNHKRCVTFGAGLLSREDTDSYVWLLKAFLKAFCKQPILVLSDQDPAMKKAIAQVFPESKHRLCMWHITSKLQVKVCWDLYNNVEFKRRFNALVWNSKMNVDEFEDGWRLFIDDYKLNDNRWFNDMFHIRDQWIPAYFKHIPLSGLMRTTSRSESENSAFQLSTNSGTTLINFMIAFEGSMEKQRHTQSVLDFKDNEKSRKTRPILEIEVNAAKYYTRQVFLQVQQEINHSIISCFQTSRISDDVFDTCVITEIKSSNKIPSEKVSDKVSIWDANLKEKEFQVCVNRNEETFTCTCMNFEHVGVLCRHIFCVMKCYRITDIPSKYVLRRWRKDLIPIELLRRTFRHGNMDADVDMMALEVFSSVDQCVGLLRADKTKLAEYVTRVKELQSIFVSESHVLPTSTKNAEFEQYVGVPMPSEITIENPTGIRNKGCGLRKRLRSGKEKGMEKTAKEPRRCARCRQLVFHDARNCPLKTKDPTAWSSGQKNQD